MKPLYQDGYATLYQGHVLDILKELPDESVDCVMTSPPYWGLRAYHTEPQIWQPSVVDLFKDHGDGNNPTWLQKWTECEHEWGDTQKEHHTGQVEQTKWKTATAAGDGQTAKYGNFCLKCNAWRGELGLEPDFNIYIDHLILIFQEVKRVMKPTGCCFVNIADSYAGGKGSSSGVFETQRDTNRKILQHGGQYTGGHGYTKAE